MVKRGGSDGPGGRKPADAPPRGIVAGYVRAVRFLRFLLVPAWIIAALAAVHYLPSLSSVSSSSSSILAAALAGNTPATDARRAAVHDFGIPLLSQTVIVQHRDKGLPAAVLANTVSRADQLDHHSLPGLGTITEAIPFINADHVTPWSRQHDTTAITYLIFKPSIGYGQRASLTHTYEKRYLSGPESGLVGATGAYAATHVESTVLSRSLSTVELAAVLVVLTVVALSFRAILAPVITLVSVGIAYFISQRILAEATIHLGIRVPSELRPIIVVLLLGIMTDYAVFFLSGFRDELRGGQGSRGGMLRTGVQVVPIVLAAGTTVAASLSVIQTARLPLFAELGPGLAISVFIGYLVSASFVPAAIAVFGRFTYWPSRPRPAQAAAGAKQAPDGGIAPARSLRAILARLTTRRVVAAPLLAGGIIALVAGASPLRGTAVGVNLIRDLPPSSAPAMAFTAAGQGIAPGIVSPTEVLLTSKGVAGHLGDLEHLQDLVARQPGVAGVIGYGSKLPKAAGALFVSRSHNAARFMVILSHDPAGAAAVHSLDHLKERMRSLLSRAGLPGATVTYAGNTALSATIVSASYGDLIRVGVFTLAVDFLILVIFLRALVAPLVLITASALVVATALSITTWVFTSVIGGPGYTFYIPFAAEVLLISFGSDYNLFLVGRIWEAEEEMPMRRAIAHATAEASSAINIAGITLAGSFATLVFVNLRPFHVMALLMVTGLVIDAFFVRTLLVPSALTLLGRAARWPGHSRASRSNVKTPR